MPSIIQNEKSKSALKKFLAKLQIPSDITTVLIKKTTQKF